MRESTGRAIRISELRKQILFLAETNDEVLEKKLVADFSLSQNVSERKVKEYLSLLIASEFCERTSKGILPKNHANMQKALEKSDQEADKLLEDLGNGS